ncbi:MAG: sulfate reduction electron transfer complex DsrMKJOP subunit DsrM [Deltaproteobacteria bacterium]|nr:sulfate reduction electron transfer complex DsrMKJOP subunit DsrM [Deltaproteobacteria bacterium]
MNFILGILFSIVMVSILALIPLAGVGLADLRYVFGVIIPYAAFAVFILGFIYKILKWSFSPNPFRIPTTAGQQKSLPWIKQNKLDNPSSTLGVLGRMFFEIFLFRSLFRNTSLEFRKGPKITYEWEKWLWIAALAFHYSFLVVVLRHLRFFTEPIPGFVHLLESADGFLEMGIAPFSGFMTPGLLISGFVLFAALLYLFLRRIYVSQTRYISLPADYFPLFLILGIVCTGIMMRYMGAFMQFAFNTDWLTVELVQVKALGIGLVTGKPVVSEDIGTIFFIHLFLVCVLLAYFPFSKLMHMGGVFLSPTRVLVNNSRAKRHVNPWDYPVHTHTYEEYEDEFREKMIEAGLPVDKTPEQGAETEEAEKE